MSRLKRVIRVVVGPAAVIVFCSSLWPSYDAAVAEPVVDLDASQKALVERLTLDRATSLAAAQRRSDERERTLLVQLAQKDKELRAQRRRAADALNALESAAAEHQELSREMETRAAHYRRELADTQRTLDGVTVERQQLVQELESRDERYKAELAEFRRSVMSLAATPSPERRAALERYAEGDRIGAFPILEELTRIEAEARRKAAEKLANRESAREYRELAALAADMKDRGEKTTTDVLHIWATAAALDPEDFWNWVYLARLYGESGDTEKAMEAARKAKEVAPDDREASVGTSELGKVQAAAGDLAGARKSFEDSYEIRRRLSAANPSSAAAQRDVSVSLERLGDVQVAAGDLAGARKSFEDSCRLICACRRPTPARRPRNATLSSRWQGWLLSRTHLCDGVKWRRCSGRCSRVALSRHATFVCSSWRSVLQPKSNRAS